MTSGVKTVSGPPPLRESFNGDQQERRGRYCVAGASREVSVLLTTRMVHGVARRYRRVT